MAKFIVAEATTMLVSIVQRSCSYWEIAGKHFVDEYEMTVTLVVSRPRFGCLELPGKSKEPGGAWRSLEEPRGA